MARLKKERKLEKIYYDMDEGFGLVMDLYEKARKIDIDIILNIIFIWIRI